MASKILNNLAEKGQTIRKYYQRRLPSDTSKDYYYMLRNTPNTEALIVEYGFLDNTNDATRLKNNYKSYADAVIDAILEYKGIDNTTGYYIVKKGDSLWSIANNNNTTVTKLKELNNLTTNTLSIGQKIKLPTTETSTISTSTYTVKKGDSLYSIAKNNNTTVSKLKDLNNLTTNTLSIGQTLKLPTTETSTIGTSTYTVKKGDSLYSIAKNNNTTVTKLKDLNNLTTNILSIGQTLKLRNDEEIIDEDYDYYTIKEGDTLYNISNKFNTDIETIKNLNNLTTDIINIGTLIKIPINDFKIYTVKQNDTLWTIANDFNTTIDKIKIDNNLTDNTIYINQKLLIK